MTSLATLGEEAKIWEVPTFKVLELFNPHESPITDLTWNHDGSAIACCCSADKTVYVRNTKASLSIPSRSFQLPSECLSLDFNSDSRFLLCGCINGSLHVYDQKNTAVTKSYTNQKIPITSVRWNWNNKCIAAGTKNGEIVLYNIVTSQASSPLVGRSVQGIQQLKYNPYQKAMLVATSDDGAVNLWDTNTRRLIRSFDQTHHASAKDVAFSPINDIFMVSVGLDKRAVFYDLQNKSSIKTIVSDYPLTCVDVLQDGATVAVGTTRGHVFLYDMRQSSTPVFSFPAHGSSVKRLAFVKKGSRKSDASSSSHSISDSLRRQLPVSPGDFNINNGSLAHRSPRSTVSDHGLISPLVNGNKSNNSVQDNQGNEKSAGNVSFDVSASGSLGGNGYQLISPVRMDNSHSMDSTGHARVAHLLSFDSFLTKMPGSVENSPNREASCHSLRAGALEGEENTDALRSPPKQLNSHGDSLLKETTSPADKSMVPAAETAAISSPRQLPSRRLQHPLNPHTVTFEDRSSLVFNDLKKNGSASAGQTSPPSRSDATRHQSPRTSVSKSSSPARPLHQLQSPRAGDPAPSSSSHAATPTETAAAAGPMAGALAGASSNNSSVTPSLRSIIQDLLQEEFQAHRAILQTEIRAMVSGSDVGQGQVSSTQETRQQPTASVSGDGQYHQHPSPEVYRAEFIRNLVKDEIWDFQDWARERFWVIKNDLTWTRIQLERIESMLADALINPALLEEMERLRAENERLRLTF